MHMADDRDDAMQGRDGNRPTAHARENLRRQAGSIWLCSTDFYDVCTIAN
jgi:hypothetical protein